MLGLWGPFDLKRVMVSLEQDKPKTILGYVREVNGFKWRSGGPVALSPSVIWLWG